MDDSRGVFQEYDAESITDAVRARLQSPDNRMQEVSDALVRHLHAFVKEVQLTPEEWLAGIAFLTRTGQTCSDVRQEFILLSDVLGVSMLVDGINHERSGTSTETTILGPFYRENPPELVLGTDLSEGLSGARMLVRGTVRSTNDQPLAGAIIDTWQADGDGFYDVQMSDEVSLRARFRTGADGKFWFWSLVPSSYPIPADGPVGDLLTAQGRHPYRPSHVHFKVSSDSHQELVTHLFIAPDEYLTSDVVFGVKESLIVSLEEVAVGESEIGPLSEGDAYFILDYDFVLVSDTNYE